MYTWDFVVLSLCLFVQVYEWRCRNGTRIASNALIHLLFLGVSSDSYARELRRWRCTNSSLPSCSGSASRRVILSCLAVWVLHNWLSLKNLSYFTFIYWLASVIKFELVATSPHSKYFESINFRDEARRRQHLVIEMLKTEQTISKNGR